MKTTYAKLDSPDRYSLKDGQSFVEQARNATFDLAGDDGIVAKTQRMSQLTWDRKKKKFVQGDGVGADNKKLVRTESGARLPASFRSGRFDEWKAKKRIVLPKVGDLEGDHARGQGSIGINKYRHNSTVEAKPLDPRSTTYEKKVYMAKKKAEKEAEANGGSTGTSKKGSASGAKAKSELRDVNAIRRDRKVQEQVSIPHSGDFAQNSPNFVSLTISAVQRTLDPAKRGAKEPGRGKDAVDSRGSHFVVYVRAVSFSCRIGCTSIFSSISVSSYCLLPETLLIPEHPWPLD